ncbi:MAG TPA: hypothetical protein VJN18_27070 [Polyangiaceae bacterium]|nr:hypothetical protein [Polyangiaceae bacterium]
MQPDSADEVSTGFITLEPEWRRYSIDLRDRDLSYVIGGFGWVTSAKENQSRDVAFYVDDIIYEGADWLDEPRFLASYPIETPYTREGAAPENVAYVYDQALALKAFLALGDQRRARLLADALVLAVSNDRHFADYRPRNAYTAGRLMSELGWEGSRNKRSARLPGWSAPDGTWLEDEFHAGSRTGEAAWVLLALISAYEVLGDEAYLETAVRVAEWIEVHCHDNRGAGGYTGGYEGWDAEQQKVSYKSSEHNIDLAVAFARLGGILDDEQWLRRSGNARRFVESMWDETEGKFWTGTLDDGVTPNPVAIPLEVQAWALLAFPDWARRFSRAMSFVTARHATAAGGFDFNTDRDGTWYEGTAHAALAYRAIGCIEDWRAVRNVLRGARLDNGAIPAASRDGLTTGFGWTYPNAAHVGATAWAIFAELGLNPFWLGCAECPR